MRVDQFRAWATLHQSGEESTGRTGQRERDQALAAMPIPVPPLAEQERIVAETERLLTIAKQAEATVETNLARAERLRQSILKQAFSGQLVPQDPNDEPASVLLERIKGEREASLAAAKNGRQPGRRRAKSRPARQPANREA